jgi:hypothetical protein
MTPAFSLSCCHLWPVRLSFPHYLKNVKIFEEKTSYWTLIVCFHFLYKFVRNISHSKKKWERYDHKCILVFTNSTPYPFQISIKLEFSLQIFEKIQILWKSGHWEPSSYMRTDEQTDRHDETNSRFPQICAKHLKDRNTQDFLWTKISLYKGYKRWRGMSSQEQRTTQKIKKSKSQLWVLCEDFPVHV